MLASDAHPEQLRRIRRAEYERMVELDFFSDERIELLDGWLVQMSPSKPAHAEAIRRLTQLLTIEDRGIVQAQLPLALSEFSEPEPDIAVVPPGNYARRHPHQALLVVEVADSSLAKDRGPKARAYAAAGIPEYWIVNLVDRALEIHTAPEGDRYAQVHSLAPGATVSPGAFPELQIPVEELLP